MTGGSGRASRVATLAVVDPWRHRLPVLAQLAADGTQVVIACSGGADSLALLALTVAAGVPAEAVYVDHGLRLGSDADIAVVAAAASALGVAASAVRIDVETGSNLEARARDARYAALERARV